MVQYSKKDLGEFKELILKKLAEAENEYKMLLQEINEMNHNGTGDADSALLNTDEAKEDAREIAMRLKKFMDGLKAALIRIENGSYGVCRVTGKLIPRERLYAVPHTTLSIDAKMGMRA